MIENSITVSHGRFFWKKILDQAEANNIADHQTLYFESANEISFFPALIYPVRTSNLKQFASDFFIPSIMRAKAISKKALAIFAVLGAFFLDLLTFSFRMLTCIPRVISNYKKNEHPLKSLLKKNGLSKELSVPNYLKIEFVYAKFDCTPVKIDEETLRTKALLDNYKLEKIVNLIEVPAFKGSKRTVKTLLMP